MAAIIMEPPKVDVNKLGNEITRSNHTWFIDDVFVPYTVIKGSKGIAITVTCYVPRELRPKVNDYLQATYKKAYIRYPTTRDL